MAAMHRARHWKSYAVLTSVIVLIWAANSRADIYGFDCVTNNNPIDAGYGESQLSLKVAEYGTDSVSFTFFNDVGSDGVNADNYCSITEIYFHDGVLVDLDTPSLVNSLGVEFSTDKKTSPGHLPGYDAVDFDLLFSADVPNSESGVDASEEWVRVVYALQPSVSFEDVLNGLNVGTMVIGVRARAFESGGSEGFINTQVVPLPGATLLGMLGLGAAGMKLRRMV